MESGHGATDDGRAAALPEGERRSASQNVEEAEVCNCEACQEIRQRFEAQQAACDRQGIEVR